MKINISNIKIAFLALIFLSCGGGSDDPAPEEPVIPPSIASLIFPEDNTECNEGTIISETESSVTFRWNPADNADSYTLTVRNLIEGTTQSVNTNTNQQTVTIKRATPFSWSVISRSNQTTQTASSETWRFYNAGTTISSYAPFPAELVSPEMGSSVASGDVTLVWNGEDIDDDIDSYDVYLDTTNPPQTKIVSEITTNSLTANLNSNTVYYWYVFSRDSQNNTSTSEIFEFRTN